MVRGVVGHVSIIAAPPSNSNTDRAFEYCNGAMIDHAIRETPRDRTSRILNQPECSFSVVWMILPQNSHCRWNAPKSLPVDWRRLELRKRLTEKIQIGGKISYAINSVPSQAKQPFNVPTAMPLTCEKCQGAAGPAAQMRTFEYDGQTVRCLALVASCMVCGHRWEDETYEAENALLAEQALTAVLGRLGSHDGYDCIASISQALSTTPRIAAR